MAPVVTITLYDSTFSALAILTPLEWSVVHKINTPSIATVNLNLSNYGGVSILDTSLYITIQRQDEANNMNEYIEFAGVIRKWTQVLDENPNVIISAMDGMHLMMDRIVAWYPDMPGYSTFPTSTYPKASNVMARLWNTNVAIESFQPPIVSADLTRRYGNTLNRWTSGYVSPASSGAIDPNIGAAVTYSCSGENLLTAMQKVAEAGGIYFWVETFNPQYGITSYNIKMGTTRGVDRTASVLMSQANNTLGNLSVSYSVIGSPSYVMANGKGKNKARIRGAWPATAPTELDLREMVVNGADNVTPAQLQVIAQRRYYQELRKRYAYSIEVLQSAMYQYGRDYFFGDVVTVVFNSTTNLQRIIWGVSIGAKSDGTEEVKIDLVAPN